MSSKHLASSLCAACVVALLAASCAAPPSSAPIDSPAIKTMDDDFGSDPDVGGSIGGDPDTGGTVGGDPAYSSPPSGTPSDGDVGDSEPDPSTDDSSSISSSTSPAPAPQGLVIDIVSCSKFEYGPDCLQKCRDAGHILNGCHVSSPHPSKANGGTGLLSGCSWRAGVQTTCSYYYPSSSEMCTVFWPGFRTSCEWAP